MSIIRVTNLCKDFKVPKKDHKGKWYTFLSRPKETKVAVKDVSFEIQRGEIVGYLGPNGAGKSTTIKMLTGILHPTSGKVLCAGFDPFKQSNAYKQHIGVLFGQRSSYANDIATRHTIALFRHIYQVPVFEFERRVDEYTKRLGVVEHLNTPYRMLSLGERMRFEILVTILHHPKILFLDEPTIGLDAHAKILIRDFLVELAHNTGMTILITSHDMGDIEQMCKRLILIDKGRLHFDGTLQKFKDTYVQTKKILIQYSKIKNKQKFVALQKHISITSHSDGVLEGTIVAGKKSSTLLKDVGEAVSIIDFNLSEPPLEYVLAQVYARE